MLLPTWEPEVQSGIQGAHVDAQFQSVCCGNCPQLAIEQRALNLSALLDHEEILVNDLFSLMHAMRQAIMFIIDHCVIQTQSSISMISRS